MIFTGYELWVDKLDIASGKLHETSYELEHGQNVILEVKKFAYTSNNTTYAVTGDYIGYWKFFPTTDAEKGIIPAWGFAEVVHSEVEGIEAGELFYGYFPMGDFLKVEAGKINDNGFLDISAHRRPLPPFYNHYIRSKNDPLYSKASENLQMLFRPLFTTSLLINHMFLKSDYYNSKQIILTSASSKTALGLAHCIHDGDDENRPKVIGLTSKKNVDFVKGSGYYDEVIPYSHLNELTPAPSSIVDFSGNNDLQASLQEHFGDALQYNCLVGMSHWGDRVGSKEQRKKGIFFFAPTYARELVGQIGPEEFYNQMSSLYFSFLEKSKEWLEIRHHRFLREIEGLHENITNGNLSPKDGHIIRL